MDFILSNLIWVILIGYVLLRFLMKRGTPPRREEGTPGKSFSPSPPSRDFPSFQGEDERGIDEEPREIPKILMNERQTESYQWQESLNEMNSSPNVNENRPEVDSDPIMTGSDQGDRILLGKKTRQKNHRGKLYANGAVQGMIWAEIFAKPRSINPHPTFRYHGRK